MKKNLLIAASFLFSVYGFCTDGNTYRYSVDLTKVKDDKVEVKLVPPTIKQEEIIFHMPKIIPGTYSIYDFGRFITDLTATAKNGQPCEVKMLDANSWKIYNADELAEISYWVNDSWDTPDQTNWVFEPAGTNIESGKNFVLNNHGFFGYFQDMAMMPYELKVVRPAGFYGSTGLSFTTSGNTDTYTTPNYNTLVDSPIMYNEPDTTFLQVGNARVLVSVYNDNRMVTSAFIAKNIEKILNAQKEYLGGQLPVDKYAFLIYLPSSFTSFGFGALEHNNSSMYFLPAFGEDYLAGMVRDVAAHEFFHIVTPLTIHSEEIHYFDFNNPEMSQHLWLYEGCTEYAAHHVQVQYGITDMNQFLGTIEEKIHAMAGFNDTVPFTVMSKGCLDTYKDQYLNVYQKGALIGMCLDLKLIRLSNGTMNLPALMKKLGQRFGKDKGFKDDELFAVITELTYPEIGDFLNRHVGGSEPLPLQEVLDYAGIGFTEGGTREVLDIGLNLSQIGYEESKKRFYLMSDDGMTDVGKAFGFMTGDVLSKINGKEVNETTIEQLLVDIFKNNKPSDKLEYEVLRQDKKGKEKKVKLKGAIGTQTVDMEAGLAPVANPTQEQLAVRKAWINQ